MVTKYIIQLTHHTCLGEVNGITYYCGQAGGPMEKSVSRFDYRKQKAKRYLLEHEALHDMQILKAMHSKSDSFEIVQVRCRN